MLKSFSPYTHSYCRAPKVNVQFLRGINKSAEGGLFLTCVSRTKNVHAYNALFVQSRRAVSVKALSFFIVSAETRAGIESYVIEFNEVFFQAAKREGKKRARRGTTRDYIR